MGNLKSDLYYLLKNAVGFLVFTLKISLGLFLPPLPPRRPNFHGQLNIRLYVWDFIVWAFHKLFNEYVKSFKPSMIFFKFMKYNFYS